MEPTWTDKQIQPKSPGLAETTDKQIQPKSPGLAERDIAMRPRNFDELYGYCKLIADTDFVAPADKGKPGQVLAKIQYGSEIGLPPMQSLRWIAHINGMPTVHSDGFWMLVRNHPLVEWTDEDPKDDGGGFSPPKAVELGYAQVTIQRRGSPKPTVRRFTFKEATDAGLVERSGAKGPWTTYRGMMLLWRARHRCASAAVPEVTGGLTPTEIAKDYDMEITAEREPQTEQIAAPQVKAPEIKKGRPAGSKTQKEESNAPESGTKKVAPSAGVAESPTDQQSKPASQQEVQEEEPKSAEKGAQIESAEKPAQVDKPWEDKALSIKDRVAVWIKHADKDELESKPNFLSYNLSKLDIDDQVKLCKEFDIARRSRT